MRRLLYVSLLWIGCGGTSHVADGGADSGSVDAGQIDAGQIDAGGRDGGAIDAGRLDGGFSCEAMDAREGEPCGPTEDPAIRFLWDGTSCAARSSPRARRAKRPTPSAWGAPVPRTRTVLPEPGGARAGAACSVTIVVYSAISSVPSTGGPTSAMVVSPANVHRPTTVCPTGTVSRRAGTATTARSVGAIPRAPTAAWATTARPRAARSRRPEAAAVEAAPAA